MNFSNNIEQWRLIDGCENYEISSHGRVRNNKTDRIMKQCNNEHGYLRITLLKDKEKKLLRVHRLVAYAFLEKQEEDTEVDHIDHNRSNNMISNLRWTTKSGNQRNRSNNKNNKSGIQGVSFLKIDNHAYWVAYWSEEKQKIKFFPVKKFGEEMAKQLAIDTRKQMAQVNGYLNHDVQIN